MLLYTCVLVFGLPTHRTLSLENPVKNAHYKVVITYSIKNYCSIANLYECGVWSAGSIGLLVISHQIRSSASATL